MLFGPALFAGFTGPAKGAPFPVVPFPVGDVLDGRDAVELVLDWSVWLDAAAGKIRDGRIPPPAPGGMGADAFSNIMDSAEAAIRKVKVELPSVPALALPSNGDKRDKRRELLSAACAVFGDATSQGDLSEERLALRSMRQQLRLQRQRLESARDILKGVDEAMQGLAVQLLTLTWINIEMNFLRRNQEAIDLVESRLASAERSAATGATALRSSGSGLLAALSVEADELSVEMNAINAETDSILQRQRLLLEEHAKLTAIESRLNDAKVRVTAAEGDMQTWGAEEERAHARADEMYRQVDSYNMQLGYAYNKCPNNEPYHLCNHAVIKANWDQQRADMRVGMAQSRQQAQLAQDAQREAHARLVQADQYRQEYEAQHQRLGGEAARGKASYQQKETALRSDSAALTTKKHQSRADVYAQENLVETGRVTQWVRSL